MSIEWFYGFSDRSMSVRVEFDQPAGAKRLGIVYNLFHIRIQRQGIMPGRGSFTRDTLVDEIHGVR